MPAKNVADFALAWLNSVRVGEEVEDDEEFRKTLDAGISTEKLETLQGTQKNFEVSTAQIVEHSLISIFPAKCPAPDQSEQCYQTEKCS